LTNFYDYIKKQKHPLTIKHFLLYIIQMKTCFIDRQCQDIYLREDGVAEVQECPLYNKVCTSKWVDMTVDYWPGDQEPRYEVERHPEFVQKAIEMFNATFGEGVLFDELL
jgi:hypothetical protein